MKTQQGKRVLAWLASACAVVAVCAVAVGLVGCGGTTTTTTEAGYSLVQDGKLIILSDLAYPPLDSVPEGGTAADVEGYEVDLMDAVAQKLGLTCEWQQVKFDTIIPIIKQGGKADLGVSAFTITDEREEEIDFTNPYLDSNQGIAMKTANAPAEADVNSTLNQAGVKVAVQSGTSGEAWAQENLPLATIVSLDDIIQAMTGVQAGLYDAACADLPVLEYMCTKSYTDLEVVEQIPTGEQYGIVVSEDNPELTAAINNALKELEDDGTVAALQEKWFGTEL
jgi:polar amino acid transport system substrate-binding protein